MVSESIWRWKAVYTYKCNTNYDCIYPCINQCKICYTLNYKDVGYYYAAHIVLKQLHFLIFNHCNCLDTVNIKTYRGKTRETREVLEPSCVPWGLHNFILVWNILLIVFHKHHCANYTLARDKRRYDIFPITFIFCLWNVWYMESLIIWKQKSTYVHINVYGSSCITKQPFDIWW